MINIYDSTTERATSTTQDLLNDLANKWEWNNIVYDETTPTNVTQLWVSDKIYIGLSTDSTPKIQVAHSNGLKKTAGTVLSAYNIVVTDKALLCGYYQTTAYKWFCVARTLDLNGTESMGVLTQYDSSGTTVTVISDNVTTASNVTYGTFNANSLYNTILMPAYSITGDEKFVGVNLAILRKSGDSGKCTLNRKHYYMMDKIAVEYT